MCDKILHFNTYILKFIVNIQDYRYEKNELHYDKEPNEINGSEIALSKRTILFSLNLIIMVICV